MLYNLNDSNAYRSFTVADSNSFFSLKIQPIGQEKKLFVCLCWGFTAQSTNGVISSAVSLPNHTFTGQA